eukprot:7999724-Pyramimonas_sp.AAC.1
MWPCFRNFPAALLQCRLAKQQTPMGSLKVIALNKPTAVRPILNPSWAAPRRGCSCHAKSGLSPDHKWAIPYAR